MELKSAWNSMKSAPKDGTIVRLLVRFETNQLDDDDEVSATIGTNGCENDCIDEWKIVGWCWSHDCFTSATGEPIGWLPLV